MILPVELCQHINLPVLCLKFLPLFYSAPFTQILSEEIAPASRHGKTP
jgi:hypothetical protein